MTVTLRYSIPLPFRYFGGVTVISSIEIIKKKINVLQREIVESNRTIGSTTNKRAKEKISERMKKSGQASNVVMSSLYDEMYRMEFGRIQDLTTSKQLLEVDLFISLNIPFNDDLKNQWTDVMFEYFFKVKNEGVKEQVGVSGREAMMDEVADDTSAHASFMTQNNVSNVVDSNMAQMQSNTASNNLSV